jgi:sortase A
MLKRIPAGRCFWLLILVLVAAGSLLIGDALWLTAKAKVAQALLSRAWSATLADGAEHKPWPWADHWPVARLVVPDLRVDQIVLAGDSGAVLAFAPGQNMQAGRPGHGDGTVVISGHRDSHFRFLRNVTPGQMIKIETRDKRIRYRVRDMAIVDANTTTLPLSSGWEQLVLVTCYPFDSLTAGGSLRYVVWAEKVSASG